MRNPENELETFGKRTSGTVEQVDVSPIEKIVICNLTCMEGYVSHNFSVNQCESHVNSDLDTISLSIVSRDNRKFNSPIDK